MLLHPSIEALRMLGGRQWALNTKGRAQMSNWGQSLVLSAEHLRADEIGRGSGRVVTLWL